MCIRDRANEDLTKDVTLIINNEDAESKIDYQNAGVVETDFGTDPRDVVLVLDVSGSMDGTPLSETKKAAVKFVETVLEQSGNTRISLVTYSGTASLVMQAENSIPRLRSAVNSLASGGNTNLHAALEQAQSVLDGQRADTKMIVVMSDGLPNEGPSEEGSYTEPVSYTHLVPGLSVCLCLSERLRAAAGRSRRRSGERSENGSE